ncbi:protease B nonderepressible form [Vanrija albida]|uniref:Protein PBN1 n=1 Tax=Vanrija albida TaxID=181172 RepID=A0ABR3Q898_9TREE
MSTSLIVTPSLSTSLHPKLRLSGPAPPSTRCILHLTLGLTDALFPDPAELADIFGPASPSPPLSPHSAQAESYLAHTRWHTSPAVIDIERPLAPESAGAVELSLAVPAGADLDIEIPLHARYLPPDASGRVTVRVASSFEGHWACFPAGGKRERFPVRLGRDELTYTLPAARESYRLTVEATTAAVVWIGFAYIAYKIARVVARSAWARTASRPKVE